MDKWDSPTCHHCKSKNPTKKDVLWEMFGFCSERCWHVNVDESKKKHRLAEADRLQKMEQTRLERDFFNSPKWNALRYRILRRYGFACMCCGATSRTGAVIQVDHIKPRSKYPHLALNEDNLQVLCKPCNDGKSNIYLDDFRPSRSGACE